MAIAAIYLGRVVSILVAYKAKQLCSGVFVAGREPAAVAGDLAVDDLAILDYIGGSVDRSAKTATASVLGVTRRAVFRRSGGCALVFAEPEVLRPMGPTAAPVAADMLPSAPHEALSPVLDRALAEPDPARPQRTRAVVVVHQGRIAGERYAPGIAAGTPLPGWSMTKSVMNALAGVLVHAGRWSLRDRVPVPEWQKPDDERRTITVDHLLRMSSGLEFDEQMLMPLTDLLYMLLAAPDMAAFAVDKDLEAAPGTRWQYSSGTTVILARAMRSVIGNQQEYEALPRRQLFDPLGMSSAMIETDATGTFVGSSLMFATARDWARFGMLYLRDGVWEGRRILPEGWVEYTRTPAPADASRRYGAHFWLGVPDGYGRSNARLPADAFHAAGHQGQFVTIVPSRDVVIVRLGATRYREAWDQAAFVRDVLAALH